MIDYRFEWDYAKAKTNLSKHKIRFEDAATVFRDKQAISLPDDEHSAEEERWLTIGLDRVTRLLVVVHTAVFREKDGYRIRIISARKATKMEQKAYTGE